MTILEIRNWLHEQNIQATIQAEAQTDVAFSLASLKSTKPQGIYYIMKADLLDKFEIKHSIVFTPELTPSDTNCLVQVENPQLVHYKLSQEFAPVVDYSFHPTAIISPKAKIHERVAIGPYCVIGDVEIDAGTVLKNHVVLEDNVKLGKNVFIDSSTVLGAGGLAWIWDENGERIMQPQLGGVVVEDDCILATDITVVKGSLSENTLIKKGTVIAHGTKIGHGSQIGAYVHMANNVSLAGNSNIGDYAFLGSACIVSSNIAIPAHTIVGAGALVTKNFEKNYLTLAGVPAKVLKENNFEEKPNGAPKPFKK